MIDAEPLFAGSAEGVVLALDAPLSLWGGLDATTGQIVDARHPQYGESVAGRVLVMRAGRGSSSSSTILAEAARLGCAPAAIVLAEADPVLVVGAIVAERLYGQAIPVMRAASINELQSGSHVRISSDGAIRRTDLT